LTLVAVLLATGCEQSTVAPVVKDVAADKNDNLTQQHLAEVWSEADSMSYCFIGGLVDLGTGATISGTPAGYPPEGYECSITIPPRPALKNKRVMVLLRVPAWGQDIDLVSYYIFTNYFGGDLDYSLAPVTIDLCPFPWLPEGNLIAYDLEKRGPEYCATNVSDVPSANVSFDPETGRMVCYVGILPYGDALTHIIPAPGNKTKIIEDPEAP
jgi:hypothetical protein